MKTTIICVALLLCATPGSAATTADPKLPLMTRVTCPAVREAVKLYGEAAAEQWARTRGISEARIEQARRCIR